MCTAFCGTLGRRSLSIILHLWETLPEAEEIIAVRLHRKIVQLATEAKWNVDLDTYRHVGSHAWIAE